ncbi:hypothetical protein [Vallitalea sp.]|jgi:hypothetical protein|uniref:hypothetical protein n=1 Tax=Vallitalea sp. TaxID=1882829 RepID=UPI0025F4567A|nr:hypothetical protein [Vallitalea sp.]MCT4688950.1 hypothetical protein [Vallitalea sp.]
MNDDRIRRLVRKTLDSQLKSIDFGYESQDAVFRKLKNSSRRSILSRFLNYKFEISVNNLIIGVSVASVAVVFLSYQTFRLTPDNLKDSQIEYIEIQMLDKLFY